MEDLKENLNFLKYKVEVLQELLFVEKCKNEEVEARLQILKGIVIKEEETKYERFARTAQSYVKQIMTDFRNNHKAIFAELRTFQNDHISFAEFSTFWNKHYPNIPLDLMSVRFMVDDGQISLWLFLESCIGRELILPDFAKVKDSLAVLESVYEKQIKEEEIKRINDERELDKSIAPMWPTIKKTLSSHFENFKPEDIIPDAVAEVIEHSVKTQNSTLSPEVAQKMANHILKAYRSSTVELDKLITEQEAKYSELNNPQSATKPPPTPRRKTLGMAAAAEAIIAANSAAKASGPPVTPKRGFSSLVSKALTAEKAKAASESASTAVVGSDAASTGSEVDSNSVPAAASNGNDAAATSVADSNDSNSQAPASNDSAAEKAKDEDDSSSAASGDSTVETIDQNGAASPTAAENAPTTTDANNATTSATTAAATPPPQGGCCTIS